MHFPKVVFVLSVLILFPVNALAVERDTDSLVIANSQAWKPYSYLDENNQPAGILIDYWRAYGATNNVDIQFQNLVELRSSHRWISSGKIRLTYMAGCFGLKRETIILIMAVKSSR